MFIPNYCGQLMVITVVPTKDVNLYLKEDEFIHSLIGTLSPKCGLDMKMLAALVNLVPL